MKLLLIVFSLTVLLISCNTNGQQAHIPPSENISCRIATSQTTSGYTSVATLERDVCFMYPSLDTCDFRIAIGYLRSPVAYATDSFGGHTHERCYSSDPVLLVANMRDSAIKVTMLMPNGRSESFYVTSGRTRFVPVMKDNSSAFVKVQTADGRTLFTNMYAKKIVYIPRFVEFVDVDLFKKEPLHCNLLSRVDEHNGVQTVAAEYGPDRHYVQLMQCGTQLLESTIHVETKLHGRWVRLGTLYRRFDPKTKKLAWNVLAVPQCELEDVRFQREDDGLAHYQL